MIPSIADKITWLGHDGFRIHAGKTIYFDPYQIAGGPVADLILVSHDHFDHCSSEDILKIQGPKTIIVTEKDCAKKLAGDIRVMKAGDILDLGEVKIEAVPSYNVDKDFHPKKKGWLGFVVETEGIRVYHAGDTDFIPEMKDLKVDIAFLPVSGTYVMTAEQAVKAALAIRPKLAIPMHYGSIVGDAQDAVRFKAALDGKVDVRIMEKG